MSNTLIASISGIRGIFGSGLDAEVLVRYASAFGVWCRRRERRGRAPLVVIGRDGRTTGSLCAEIVSGTLKAAGCDVLDAGMATTPTTEMAVVFESASGGIMLSASHNPPQWNALKLFNERGEFLGPEQAAEVLELARDAVSTVGYDEVGRGSKKDFLDAHLDAILALEFMRPDKIASRAFRVVADGINSVGGIAVPRLLERLGVDGESVICLNCEPTGVFAHPAEPLPENLTETCQAVREAGADLGVVVDPDVDRLALIDGTGTYVSEELTQVITADFLWRLRSGPFVTNLSSSRAIDDVARRYDQPVYRSAVGEINVVRKMQEVGAILGGEGNGGVILPDLHYGRDALAGIALVLQHLADLEISLADLRRSLPAYEVVKAKLDVEGIDPERAIAQLVERFRDERLDTTDGLKVEFESGWVHLRKSNTEPIIRIYAEARSEEDAEALVARMRSEVLRVAG